MYGRTPRHNLEEASHSQPKTKYLCRLASRRHIIEFMHYEINIRAIIPLAWKKGPSNS